MIGGECLHLAEEREGEIAGQAVRAETEIHAAFPQRPWQNDGGVGRTHLQVGGLAGFVRPLLERVGFEISGALSDFVKTSHEIATELVSHVIVVKNFEPMADFIASGAGVNVADRRR